MLKTIIAEDHEIFRNSLVKILTNEGVCDIIAQVSNGTELLEVLKTATPDIILMDISMPVMDGIEATSKVTEKYPKIKVLVISSYGDEKYYYKMVEAGAKGFVLKSGSLEELKNAIKIIGEGGNWFSPQLLENIVTEFNDTNINDEESEIIGIELNVLKEICQGNNIETIMKNLKMSNADVKKYTENLLFKTNCTNTSGLVLYAIQHKIINI